MTKDNSAQIIDQDAVIPSEAEGAQGIAAKD
jgi:hypothetical protein